MGKYKEGRDLFDSYELFEDLADNPVSRTYRISVSALINFVTSKREEAINDIKVLRFFASDQILRAISSERLRFSAIRCASFQLFIAFW